MLEKVQATPGEESKGHPSSFVTLVGSGGIVFDTDHELGGNRPSTVRDERYANNTLVCATSHLFDNSFEVTTFLLRLEVLDLDYGFRVIYEIIGIDISTITFEFLRGLEYKVDGVQLLIV